MIDERITRLVSLFMSSLNRSNIRAYPVESNDISRAEIVSSFLKWMTTSGYIPRYKREMELGANYLLERGLLITYVGWHSEDRQFLQKLTLEQIAELDPNIFGAVKSGEKDDELVFILQNIFEGVTEKRAKKALKELRTLLLLEDLLYSSRA
ncbi:MAG: hypothetical protein ACYSW3_30690 [Planctomycetota bacterium]